MNGTGQQASAGHDVFLKTQGNQEYLTFFLDSQEYGLDILQVQEIRQWSPVTHLPNAPEHVRGVINIRGEIVPIVDPRVRFAMPVVDPTAMTVVIIVKANGGSRLVGLVVDAVSDVYDVSADDLSDADDPMVRYGSEYTGGIVTVNENVIVILNIDALVGESNLI